MRQKCLWIAALFITAAQLYGGSAAKAPARVPVCMARISDVREAAEALSLASFMFRAVGVNIVWREGLAHCEAGSIRIGVSENTPSRLLPNAMAYAMPYAGFRAFAAQENSTDLNDGIHIRVFYDRIQLAGGGLVPRLLAHVLTHEITHVLQGLTHHAAEGVMKARWTQNDYTAMMRRQLVLGREDIDLLHRGIAVRTEAQKSGTIAAGWQLAAAAGTGSARITE